MSNTNPGISFVVLSDGLGKWRKGDVIENRVLRESGSNIERLLTLKAIREATVNEAGISHIELVTPERHLSYEHQLAEKDQEISRLTGRVASLEEQIATGIHLKQPAHSGFNESVLIEEKDRAVKTLEARVTVLNQEVAVAKSESATLRSELVLARAELNAAKSVTADLAKAEADKAAAPKAEDKPRTDGKAEDKAKAKRASDPALPPPPPPPALAPMPDNPGGPSRIRRVA